MDIIGIRVVKPLRYAFLLARATPSEMVALAHRLDQQPRDLLAAPLRRVGDGEAGTVLYEGIARVQDVYPYPEEGEGYAEYLDPAGLDAFISACPGLPLLLGEAVRGQVLHPGQAAGDPVQIGRENWQEWQVGTVLSGERIRLPDGRAAAKVRMAVQDADAIAAIDAGRVTGLSPDYRLRPSDLVPSSGEFKGQRYSAVQTGGIFNNLCLVDSPRGGDACILRHDAATRGDGASMAVDLNAIRDMLTPEVLKDPAVKAFIMGLLGVPAEPAAPEMDAKPPMEDPGVVAAMDGLRKDAAAATARADAAEAALAQHRADAAANALKDRAKRLDAALLRARIERPAGFDPASPTEDACAAANDALIASIGATDPYRPDVTARRDASITIPPDLDV